MFSIPEARSEIWRIWTHATTALFTLTLYGCAALGGASVPSISVPAEGLPAPIAKSISDAALPLNSIGILIVPVGKLDQPRVAHNAELPLQPGSTMKLMTAIPALDLLGPTYRGAAEWRAAPAQGGVLAGPHVIRGLGHPELNLEATTRWLKTLKDTGVKHLAGDILIDRSAYAPARPDVGVAPFDESIEFRYNMIPDALSLNVNLIGLRLKSDTTTLSVSLDPPLPGIALAHQMSISTTACGSWGSGWKMPIVHSSEGTVTVTLLGSFPRNCSISTELNVLDRTQFAQSFLQYVWQSLGGEWTATVRELRADEPAPDLPLRARAESKPLSEIVRDINKRSDNQITRMIYLALANQAPAPAKGSTAERAEAALRAWMSKNGVGSQGFVVDNGSGLSRSERVSVLSLVQTLEASRKSRWAPELQASLPIVGVDGSMRNRGKDTTAAERARVKTGTLRDAWAVAGYVSDANDQPLIIAAIVNAPVGSGDKARRLLDQVLIWAAQSK